MTVTVGTLAANLVGDVTGDVNGNVTGDVTGNLTGTASVATSVTATANNGTNETVYLTFIDGQTGSQGIESDSNLYYNPSTNTLTAQVFDGQATGATATIITGLTSESTIADDDLIMIYDSSNTGLRKMTKANFVSALGGGTMSSFTLTADSGTNQTVDDGETVDIAGGTGISTVVSATNTVTVGITAGGVGTTQLAASSVTNAKIAADAVDSAQIADGAVDNVHLAGGITFAKLDGGAYLTSAEAFSDSDTQLMTAAAINDRIQSFGYSTTTGTVTSVSGTGSVNGITLSGSVTSTGSLTLGGSLSNITVSQLAGSAVITSAESFSDDDTTLMTSAAIDDRILSYGYSTTTGTVTSITAGTGLSGGTITSTGTIAIANGGVDTLQLAAGSNHFILREM